MSEELAQRSFDLSLIRKLEDEGALTDTGLHLERLDEEVTFEEFQALGAFLGYTKRVTSWLLGDWLIYGEATFGEKLSQAAEATGLSEGTLRNYFWVCERIPATRRLPHPVSFSVHQTVAPLPPKEQKRWLAVAQRENLSQRDLRARMRDEAVALEAHTTRQADGTPPRSSESGGEARPGTPPDTLPDTVSTWNGLPAVYVVDGALCRRLVKEAVEAEEVGWVKVPRDCIARLTGIIGEEEW